MWNTEVKQPNLLGPTHQSPLIISPLFVYLGCLDFFQEGILSQEFASYRMSLKTIFVSNKRHIFHFAKWNADCYWLQEWDLKFVPNNLLTPDKTLFVRSKRQKIWILLLFLSYLQILPIIWKPQGEMSTDMMVIVGHMWGASDVCVIRFHDDWVLPSGMSLVSLCGRLPVSLFPLFLFGLHGPQRSLNYYTAIWTGGQTVKGCIWPKSPVCLQK